MASSILFPPTLTDECTTTPPKQMTAASVVPPPISTIIFPEGLAMGILAPIAAAKGSSIKKAVLAPADKVASSIALFSTDVTPAGAQIITSGLNNLLRPQTLSKKYLIIASVIT